MQIKPNFYIYSIPNKRGLDLQCIPSVSPPSHEIAMETYVYTHTYRYNMFVKFFFYSFCTS